MKYLVNHWINVDMIAEEVIEDDSINFSNNNLGKYNEPSEKANYKLIDSIKVKRTTYEKYDEKFNNTSKESSSNK